MMIRCPLCGRGDETRTGVVPEGWTRTTINLDGTQRSTHAHTRCMADVADGRSEGLSAQAWADEFEADDPVAPDVLVAQLNAQLAGLGIGPPRRHHPAMRECEVLADRSHKFVEVHHHPTGESVVVEQPDIVAAFAHLTRPPTRIELRAYLLGRVAQHMTE